jgi:hypothetical protein
MAQAITFSGIGDVSFSGWFGVALGLFLEIGPEPLIVFGLIGISDTEGDMIGAMLNTFGRGKQQQAPVHMRQPTPQPAQKYEPKFRPQSGGSNKSSFPSRGDTYRQD